MTALTEADVRRIVREEITGDRRRSNRDFAEQMLKSSRVSAAVNPAKPGSLLAEIQGLRRDAAEQGLASALLADVSSDLLDGVPESVDLGGEAGLAEVVAVLKKPAVHAGIAADSLDLFGDGVAHDSSLSVGAGTSTVATADSGGQFPPLPPVVDQPGGTVSAEPVRVLNPRSRSTAHADNPPGT